MSLPIVTTILGAGVGAVLGGPRGAAYGAGAGLALGALIDPKRASASTLIGPRPLPPGSDLGQVALSVCLAEKARWGAAAPSIEQIDAYLAGSEPNGAELAAMNAQGNIVNFCASAQGWAEHQTPFAPLPPWRAAAKALMADAQAARRGPWHPAQELISDWRPSPGDLAIYWRGTPDGPFGHVRRVIRVVDVDHYEATGANETLRRWNVAVASFWAENLLGFASGAAGAASELLYEAANPFAFVVDPPVTEVELAAFSGR